MKVFLPVQYVLPEALVHHHQNVRFWAPRQLHRPEQPFHPLRGQPHFQQSPKIIQKGSVGEVCKSVELCLTPVQIPYQLCYVMFWNTNFSHFINQIVRFQWMDISDFQRFTWYVTDKVTLPSVYSAPLYSQPFPSQAQWVTTGYKNPAKKSVILTGATVPKHCYCIYILKFLKEGFPDN